MTSANKQPAVRRLAVDRLWIEGNAGRYAVGLGKYDLGHAERIGRRKWKTSSGHYAGTLRQAAAWLLAYRLREVRP